MARSFWSSTVFGLALLALLMPCILAQETPAEVLGPQDLSPIAEPTAPVAAPISSPVFEPTPVPASIPSPAPVVVPVVTPVMAPAPIQVPPTSLGCIGLAPTPAFWCDGRQWVHDDDLTVDGTYLHITGPTFINGSLEVTRSGTLGLSPPLPSTGWNDKVLSLLTIAGCISSSSAPTVSLTDPTVKYLTSMSGNTYTTWGIDTGCNTNSLSTSWNAQYGDAQPVLTTAACYTFIDQYRTFPSEQPGRYVSRIRFQWRYTCGSPYYSTTPNKRPVPVGAIVGGVVGGITAVALVAFCCCCGGCKGGGGGGGGGGWDNSSSNNNDSSSYGTFDSGGGGGGGGGSDWTSSNAGSWD